MTIYTIEDTETVPKHADNASTFRRLLYVETIHVKRWDAGWSDKYVEDKIFTDAVVTFDLYVDFRPGLRAQWRPWIYAYWSRTQHRLEPFEKLASPYGIGYAIQHGREVVARRWWELINQRFPKVAMVPELPE